jgi:kynurenine formamidase
MKVWQLLSANVGITVALLTKLHGQKANDLWQVYQVALRKAKYVDLTHTITPTIRVWKGFGPSKFTPTVNPENGEPYNYEKDGFSATAYQLSTDQLGTQLDPPAHWNPEFPSMDELPATFAVRPLVVISIVDQVAKDPKYALQVQDILGCLASYA